MGACEGISSEAFPWLLVQGARSPQACGDRRATSPASREALMIERYSDHAANERTFLAWVRTGIATIAFGFVVEKFNLFVRTLAQANGNASAQDAGRLQQTHLTGAFSHYDGLILIVVGMAVILLSLVRFIRTSRMIDDQEVHSV